MFSNFINREEISAASALRAYSSNMAWIPVVGILCVSLPIAWSFEQVVDPPAEYCADLRPQNLLNIPKLLGTWYAAEFISHRNMISGQKSDLSCIVIEIFELSGSVSVDNFDFEDVLCLNWSQMYWR